MEPRTGWRQSLASAIEELDLEGGFACSGGDYEGDIAGPLPELSVAGAGRVSLPLAAQQAAAILAAGEAAPFGKGPNTVLDPAVRQATQLDASLVQVTSAWETTLQDITADIASGLGIDAIADVEARLYKLLLYQPGGHFVAHRDTEKEPGMFATLVVQLPVAGGHSGGALRVSHRGQVFEWDSAAVSRSGHLTYAAFYADCEHELTAVTSGLRMVLVYNLVRTVPGSPLRAPPGGRAASAEALAAAVRGWEAAAEGPGTAPPRLLALPLEHKYTEANLSFSGLKGRDASVVELLAGCELLDVHLALVTKRVMGSATMDWSYHRRKRRRGYGGWGCGRRRWRCGGYDDEDEDEEDEMYDEPSDDGADAEMLDVIDEETETRKWVSVSGRAVNLNRLRFELDKFLLGGEGLFDGSEGLQPDEREYEGYTGNTGPTLEYFYHRAVAVIWPRSRSATIACAAGFGAATDLLERLMAGLSAGGAQQGAAQQEGGEEEARRRSRKREARLQEFKQLLRAVMAMAERTPREAFPGDAYAGANAARALKLAASPHLLEVAGASSAKCFVAALSASEGLVSPAVVQALAAAAEAIPDSDLEQSIVALVPRCFEKQFEHCVQLAKEPAAPEALRSRVAEALMAAALGPGFARLQQGDVLAMARLVCEGGPLFQQHQAAFSAAVLARPDRQVLLQALMREPCVARGAAAGVAAVVALVQERERELSGLVARGPPVMRWEQRNARLPEYPQVEAFLRGPERAATFRGIFGNIRHARDWANQYFRWRRTETCGYSATAAAGGIGRNAFCTVTKDQRTYERAVQLYEATLKELREVRALAAAAAAAIGVAAGCGAAAPAPGACATMGGSGGGEVAAAGRGAPRVVASAGAGAPVVDLTGDD